MTIERIAAGFLCLVSLLQPVETFAAQCNMKSPPVCLDSTPCKNVHDPLYPNNPAKTVKVCLSNAAQVGALTTSATCWQYTSTYDCLDPNAISKYNDTCAPIAADTSGCPSYQELNTKCAEPLTSGGLCPSFDVTYQCLSKPGVSYAEQNCGGLTLCVGAACTLGSPEKNSAFAKVAAVAEVSRQAAMYADKAAGDATTDPNSIRVFTGYGGHCSQNTLGMSDCCVPNSKGGDWRNQIIAEELLKMGWNAYVKHIVGSSYTYDTLFDAGTQLVDKAVKGSTDVINRWSSNGAPAPAAPAPITPAPKPTSPNVQTKPVTGGWTSATYSVGGVVGGALGAMGGSALSKQWSANTQWTGVIVATGTAVGTVAGTALAGAVATTGSVNGAMATINPYVMVAVLVISIVMALIACDKDEATLQLKLGANLCHWVGSYCQTTDPITGRCMTRMQDYCCFNGILPKIIQEQGRPQIGKGWGVPGATDCSGFTVTELSSLNFAKMDFAEFTKEIVAKSIPDQASLGKAITERMNQYFSNNTNPMATMGVVVPTPAPAQIVTVAASNSLPTAPALGKCDISVVKGVPAPNGNISGTFNISNCNPNAKMIWSYVGTCADIPKYASLDLIPSSDMTLTDAAGTTSFSVTVPASCLGQSSPAINNTWKVLVNDSAAGLIGTVTAPW